jgi:hypothetical protein
MQTPTQILPQKQMQYNNNLPQYSPQQIHTSEFINAPRIEIQTQNDTIPSSNPLKFQNPTQPPPKTLQMLPSQPEGITEFLKNNSEILVSSSSSTSSNPLQSKESVLQSHPELKQNLEKAFAQRKVIYSEQTSEKFNRYAHLLPGSNKSETSKTSSDFSDEFLYNDGCNSENNKSSETSSVLSSYSSENYLQEYQAKSIKAKIEDSYTSQEMSSMGDLDGEQQNELDYSQSDADDHENHINAFLKNSNADLKTPQMQVFNYKPVFLKEETKKDIDVLSSDSESFGDNCQGLFNHDQKAQLNMVPSQNQNRELLEFNFKQNASANGNSQKKVQLNERLSSAGNKENQSSNVKFSNNGDVMYAGGRTKEQILAQRKEMMKPNRLKNSESYISE